MTAQPSAGIIAGSGYASRTVEAENDVPGSHDTVGGSMEYQKTISVLLLRGLGKRAPEFRKGNASMIIGASRPFSDDQARPGIRACDR